MLSLKFDLTGITSQVDKLTEVVQGAIRPAAQAGAQVYYNEMKILAARSEKGTGNGLLAKSIYQKYVDDSRNSTPGERARYTISWNKGKGTKTPFAGHGQLVEYGYWQRYVMAKNKAGQFVGPALQPGAAKMRKPKKGDSQAYKDSYWVPLAVPIYHAPRSFLRATYDAKHTEAAAAVNQEMHDRILKAFI